MMQFTTETGKFHVISHGNGWAYEITDQATGDSLWLQDDDAIWIEEQTDKFQNEDALNSIFDNVI
jgi:hypothetical protein